MMKYILLLLAVSANLALAFGKPARKAIVSYDDFKGLVQKVEAHRESRLIDLKTFNKMSKEPGVIILDTRAAFRYNRIHIKGAKHLEFSEFTQGRLAEVIPSFDTKILIYCNNNFEGNQVNFITKRVLPGSIANGQVGREFASQQTPLTLALNIPTYINLYGYGYRNVYELSELVRVDDPRITFEGSTINPRLGR